MESGYIWCDLDDKYVLVRKKIMIYFKNLNFEGIMDILVLMEYGLGETQGKLVSHCYFMFMIGMKQYNYSQLSYEQISVNLYF